MFSRKIIFPFIFFVCSKVLLTAQNLSGFRADIPPNEPVFTIVDNRQFNGYTNYWHNDYTRWHRYGNLFKVAVTDIVPSVLQSKVDAAMDMGLPGLLLQEGFVSRLWANPYQTMKNPSMAELEEAVGQGNLLVLVDPSTEVGRELNRRAQPVFAWAEGLQSYQFKTADFNRTKAFYLVDGNRYLFVISSSSQGDINRLQALIEHTETLLRRYRLCKGWFGAKTLLKSVTCTPGHPLEIMGIGMNEGNSWFIFDGYMDFLMQKELENWVDEVKLPVVADVGFSPIYGCRDYEGLQVQDMATPQAWIDYAHQKGGYAFRSVWDPASDAYRFDGYLTNEGNKVQIDEENIPFVHNSTGHLNENLTSSTMLFIEREKPLTKQVIWQAIMDRREVAVSEGGRMMGPAAFRNALQLLYLDKIYLEDVFNDRIDIRARVDGYDLTVTLRNLSPENISGKIEVAAAPGLSSAQASSGEIGLAGNEVKQLKIPLTPVVETMGRTNPIAVRFRWNGREKSTVTLLDLPPVVSVHRLLYAHAPEVEFPVTLHNFSTKRSFPVSVSVYKNGDDRSEIWRQTKQCDAAAASYRKMDFRLPLKPGNYTVKVTALGAASESRLGVGRPVGKPYAYALDLDSDGIDEYRMENDSVQITLLRTGARVIEYRVKSRNDNVLFKSWPKKTVSHRRPYRMRGYYPYGGFEDFLGQASMETHQVYDARIVKKEGDWVRVEMETDYYGNRLKKIFTLYGNSPLLEVRFELNFSNPEANVIGPQPILELGKTHGTEDLFVVPAEGGWKEYRMRPEKSYGQAIHLQEGWNAGYDTIEDISFVGAFPVDQPLFLHMWMNHPSNSDAPHYYVEFQPWTPIVQKTTMYFTYYLWGSGGSWRNAVEELRRRNLISIKK